MKKFNIDACKEGDIIAGRNEEGQNAYLIRMILGSVTNHNALIIKHNTRGWGIGDMTPPQGEFVPFSRYEDLVNSGKYHVRVFRIKDATDFERKKMSTYWQLKVDRMPYDEKSVKKLWVMRIVNSLPWKIHGMWCTRAIGIVCEWVFPDYRNIFRKPFVKGNPLKKNETPRTIENRLVAGYLEDVTDQVLVDS